MTDEQQAPATEEFPAQMSAADSLMWRIERDPLLRSTITAVCLLDRAPDWEAVRDRVAAATRSIPRLTQRVVDGLPELGGTPRWEPDPNFDFDYHLRRLMLRPPASFESVLELASHSAMASFDRGRPLWEFQVVEGLEGGRAALVQKIHHSVADGIAGLRLAASLFDLERSPAQAVPAGAAAAGDTDRLSLAGRAAGTWRSAAGAAASVPGRAIGAGAGMVRSPAGATRRAIESARWTARLVAPARAPLSPVMRGRGTSLRFATLDVGVAELYAAGKAADCKLNDAYLAAVAGGLGRYHEEHGRPVQSLRITLPISIRREHDPVGTNRVTLVRFAVPIAQDPVERMRRIRDLAGEWKAGPALELTDLLTRGINALPAPLATAIFGQILKNIDFVATNVRGFPAPLYVGGAEILRLYAFAPPIGAALNVALISHVDTCCIGINTDTRAVPDSDVLVKCIGAGFDEVLEVGR